MSTKWKKIIVFLAILGLTAMFGCAGFQDAVTPCYIPPKALDYASEPATMILPFTTLLDAKRVGFKMDYVHAVNQVKDKMTYEFLKGISAFHMAGAEELQAALFSPEGPIGLMLPTIMGGTLGALLIKRPGDKSKKEIEIENGGKEKKK